MATAEISEYIEDFVGKEITCDDKKTIGYVEEEKLSVDIEATEEATPCFLEDLNPATPIGFEEMEFKTAIERQLSESTKISTIDYEVDSNKVMIQDLKSSVVSLKVSTSRIEREVKDLTEKVHTFNAEKKTLDNSLIDLEFRFNELVTHEDNDDQVLSKSTVSSEDDKSAELQNHVKNVVEKLEGKVQQMDEKISIIDKQNEKVRCISQEIEKHERMVQEIRRMLSHQERELNKFSKFKEPPSVTKMKPTPPTAQNTVLLQNTVNEFIAKTELNERSIATAWVGLVGALLLIPIAWIMGKFF